MNKGWKVLWCGWLLFLLSLALPAVSLDMGAWNASPLRFSPGWSCALVMWPFYFSNGLLLVSPLLMRIKLRYKSPWVRYVMAGCFFASLIGAVACWPAFRAVHAGYVLWCLSFAVTAVAMWIDDGGPGIRKEGGKV